MALRLSTGLRDELFDRKAEPVVVEVAIATVSFEIGSGPNGGDKILDSGNGLAEAIRKGKLLVYGSASNNGVFDVKSVATDGSYIEVASGSLAVEAIGATVTIMAAHGGSWSDLLRNGVFRIFPGTQPSSANDTEGTSHLVEVSINSLAFSVGGTNGINCNDSSGGTLTKAADEVWSGLGVADGTAGWFRWYDKDRTTGASTTAVRLDGAIAQSGSQFNMSNTAITTGGTVTIDSLAATLPTL